MQRGVIVNAAWSILREDSLEGFYPLGLLKVTVPQMTPE